MACIYKYNDQWLSEEEILKVLSERKEFKSLYNNLLKELESGKGLEVLNRIKRDYNTKYKIKPDLINLGKRLLTEDSETFILPHIGNLDDGDYAVFIKNKLIGNYKTFDEAKKIFNDYNKYTLEEQQEEAIVELMSLMVAEKLDAVKDGKLISLLKRLLKEIKAFIKDLLKQREVEIDKLPDNMTLGDLSDLLAYSNSKLILPGNEVVYTTPDNEKFKTYTEASKHISNLAKSIEDIDLDNISLLKEKPKYKIGDYFGQYEKGFIKEEGLNKIETQEEADYLNSQEYRVQEPTLIKNFIEKNKEYEQSKEIIEEWKKINNIQYNPEEIYSRGQEFVSVVGAYSNFDVNLMMQNLLQHIEDNQKAGGFLALSAFTKPIDKKINHLEGGGGKIKFKIYPKPEDILWASNIDVFSGSVWDAAEKVNKDKKSELLGVSYTKYPALHYVNTVQPNLADIIDKLSHHHNELGIVLTSNNFRLEYDSDIPYQTKKIIDGINSILDQKYGKLVKPEIKSPRKLTIQEKEELDNLKDLQAAALKTPLPDFLSFEDLFSKQDQDRINELQKTVGIQPAQTNDTIKESIESVKSKVEHNEELYRFQANYSEENGNYYKYVEEYDDNNEDEFDVSETNVTVRKIKITKEEYENNKPKLKEYTSQALINTKVAKLKEVAKKYPRSLIRSEVKSIRNTGLFSPEEKLFQKTTPKVYSASDEESTLYPKIVDYIKENGFNPNEPYYKEYLEAGHILDYSPEEIALVHYNLAYPDENVQPEDLFERLEPQEKEALSNMNIDYTQISTEEARMLLYEPGKAVELMRNFYKLRRGDNTEIFYQIVREKEEDLTNYGCL